jgi:hypothetical protein
LVAATKEKLLTEPLSPPSTKSLRIFWTNLPNLKCAPYPRTKNLYRRKSWHIQKLSSSSNLHYLVLMPLTKSLLQDMMVIYLMPLKKHLNYISKIKEE